jgi:hypothetical protein
MSYYKVTLVKVIYSEIEVITEASGHDHAIDKARSKADLCNFPPGNTRYQTDGSTPIFGENLHMLGLQFIK